MQDITINWRSIEKQQAVVVVTESPMDAIKRDAAALVAGLPAGSTEASRVLKAKSAAVQDLYTRCAAISNDAARTLTAILNEVLAGQHNLSVIDARSKEAPAISWRQNVACFIVVDPSYLHTDGKGGYLALSA